VIASPLGEHPGEGSEIQAAVAYVEPPEAQAGDLHEDTHEGRSRGTHLAGSYIHDPLVRLDDGVMEPDSGIGLVGRTPLPREALVEALDRQGRGDITGLMSARAVGHQQEQIGAIPDCLREVAIFVTRPQMADVRQPRDAAQTLQFRGAF